MNEFKKAIYKIEELIGFAGWQIGENPEVEEYLAECGYNMDYTPENIVLEILLDRFKN